MKLIKTVFFILLVPGFLLGIVPVYLVPRVPGPALSPGVWNWTAIPLWLLGICIILWCAVDFVYKGKGTPVPLDPPKELVVTGLYRFSRNPMYIGALLVQVGNLIWFGAFNQGIYWFFIFIGFSLFIRANEEPYLRKTYGQVYEDYCQAVPRWIPKIPDLKHHF